jgi:hypothetical protein
MGSIGSVDDVGTRSVWGSARSDRGRVVRIPVSQRRTRRSPLYEEELMETAYEPNIPRSLEEVCHPLRMALLVYDMQVGIVSQLPHGSEITTKVTEVL